MDPVDPEERQMQRASRSSTRHLATSLSLAASLAALQLGAVAAQPVVRPLRPVAPVIPLRPAQPVQAPDPQVPDAA